MRVSWRETLRLRNSWKVLKTCWRYWGTVSCRIYKRRMFLRYLVCIPVSRSFYLWIWENETRLFFSLSFASSCLQRLIQSIPLTYVLNSIHLLSKFKRFPKITFHDFIPFLKSNENIIWLRQDELQHGEHSTRAPSNWIGNVWPNNAEQRSNPFAPRCRLQKLGHILSAGHRN